jgi:HSP20 family protein
VDIYEHDNAIVVKADVPGVKPENVSVEIAGNVLTIAADVEEEKEEKRQGYHLKERRTGSFRRVVSLPPGADANKAEASFVNGTLTVTIPKSEASKPRSVQIKTKATKA